MDETKLTDNQNEARPNVVRERILAVIGSLKDKINYLFYTIFHWITVDKYYYGGGFHIDIYIGFQKINHLCMHYVNYVPDKITIINKINESKKEAIILRRKFASFNSR